MQEGQSGPGRSAAPGTFFGYRNLPVQERCGVMGNRLRLFCIDGNGTINRAGLHGNQVPVTGIAAFGLVGGSQYNNACQAEQAEDCIL
jgi:hypothetical protein